MRKQFAAPSTAKPAAPIEAVDAALTDMIVFPRHKSAYVRSPAHARCCPRLTICVQTRFAEARRAELKQQFPELSVTELNKVRPSVRAQFEARLTRHTCAIDRRCSGRSGMN